MILLLKFLIRVAFAYYVAVMLLAFSTLPLIMKKKNVSPLSRMGWEIILYFTLLYLIFFGDSRYHFQNMPWVMMYAAVPISMWLRRSEATEPAEESLATASSAR